MPARPTTPGSGEARLDSQFSIERTLGEGSFGKIKLALHLATNERVALKCLDRSRIEREAGSSERVIREILLLRHLRHPNLNRMLQVIQTKRMVYLVLEYEPNGDLLALIRRVGALSEDRARLIFRELLAGVAYCHARKIVHRDLKPENIMLDAHDHVKIIDFGFANVLDEADGDGDAATGSSTRPLSTFCGSLAYASPELLQNQQYEGAPVDVWSLGIILYVMLVGTLPYDESNPSRMYGQILSGHIPLPPTMSPALQRLMSAMLHRQPEQRPTTQQLCADPWVAGPDGPVVVHRGHDPTAPRFDKTLLSELEACGYQLEHLWQEVQKGYPGPVHTAYDLLENRATRRAQQARDAEAAATAAAAEAAATAAAAATMIAVAATAAADTASVAAATAFAATTSPATIASPASPPPAPKGLRALVEEDEEAEEEEEPLKKASAQRETTATAVTTSSESFALSGIRAPRGLRARYGMGWGQRASASASASASAFASASTLMDAGIATPHQDGTIKTSGPDGLATPTEPAPIADPGSSAASRSSEPASC